MTAITKIGLIRHFEVVRGLPARGVMTAADLHAWRQEYEHSEVIPKPVDLGGIDWQHCYASTSARALTTAKTVHSGSIHETDQLREPAVRQFDTGRLRMPYAGWRLLLRLAWMTSHPSQREGKARFFSNIDAVVSTLRAHAGASTLVVSHAGAMIFLRKALLRSGFDGPRFTVPEPGRLYVFEGCWE